MSESTRWDADWPAAIEELAPAIHEVDRDAVRVWFQFFPLLTAEVEKDPVFYQRRGLAVLAGQEDSSHSFLYGHRYWGAVKKALIGRVAAGTLSECVRDVAKASGAPMEFALGMAAIGWMTVRQAGTEFLERPFVWKGKKESPAEFARRRLPGGGLLARLLDGKPRVYFHKAGVEESFPVIPTQEMTTAAEQDKRPWHASDERCYEGMGPIPVDCRSGSCGTCWVGVVGGDEKLDPVTEFEQKRMEYFGYWDSGFHEERGGRPLIRLACQTVVQGSVAVVIPPWNAVYGKVRRERKGSI